MNAEIEQHWLDDSLCNALAASKVGRYDGLTVEQHLEMLIERVRERMATPPYNENGDMVTRMGQVFRQVGWQINGGAFDGRIVRTEEEVETHRQSSPHGGISPVYIEVGTE